MHWLLILCLCPTLWAAGLVGRVTDGQRPLQGVRIYPDRGVKPWPAVLPPHATTDAEGRFKLEVPDSDAFLVVEKSGWQRDLVPRSEFQRDVVLRHAPEYRVEKVLIVRLDFPDHPCTISDDTLRERYFYRQPGIASAASYLYEVSKGSLELEEGAILHLKDVEHPPLRNDEDRLEMVHWVLGKLKDLPLGDLDRVDNRTGALKPDGQPDHLWILPPGNPQTVTHNHSDLSAISYLARLPWKPEARWSAVFFPDETPLGNVVHENFHAMGEHRVDDFYLDADHPLTAGIWDLMDVGMYRGWDSLHPEEGPWFQDTAYSPSQPMGWTRAELWYRGRFSETVSTLKLGSGEKAWTGWIEPLARAPRMHPQRLVLPDPQHRGTFWELSVRAALGYDRGRVGDRWGPGYEGLIVAHVDPGKLTPDEPLGPVRVIGAHVPASLATFKPKQPKFFPNLRSVLDDAAYRIGPGERYKGKDGALSWEIVAMDEDGRMQVRVAIR